MEDTFRDIAALVAAIGTVGAFVVGGIQIAIERHHRRSVARRSQADRVSAWLADDRTVVLLNQSDSPVYRALLVIVFVQGAAPRIGEKRIKHDKEFRTLALIPPGRFKVEPRGVDRGMSLVPAAELAFTDARGGHWIRRATGELVQINKEPLAHYDEHEPQEWLIPAPDET